MQTSLNVGLVVLELVGQLQLATSTVVHKRGVLEAMVMEKQAPPPQLQALSPLLLPLTPPTRLIPLIPLMPLTPQMPLQAAAVSNR